MKVYEGLLHLRSHEPDSEAPSYPRSHPCSQSPVPGRQFPVAVYHLPVPRSQVPTRSQFLASSSQLPISSQFLWSWSWLWPRFGLGSRVPGWETPASRRAALDTAKFPVPSSQLRTSSQFLVFSSQFLILKKVAWGAGGWGLGGQCGEGKKQRLEDLPTWREPGVGRALPSDSPERSLKQDPQLRCREKFRFLNWGQVPVVTARVAAARVPAAQLHVPSKSHLDT